MGPTEFYSYLKPLLALQEMATEWVGDPPTESVESLVKPNKSVFSGLQGHPKPLQSTGPILAHLITRRQNSAVTDIQQLVEWFPQRDTVRNTLIPVLDSPPRQSASRVPPTVPRPSGHPGPEAPFDPDLVPVSRLLSTGEAQEVHAEPLSWGHERSGLTCQAKRLFLVLFRSSHVPATFADQDFHRPWQELAQMPMTQGLAHDIRNFIRSSPVAPGESAAESAVPLPDSQSVLAELLKWIHSRVDLEAPAKRLHLVMFSRKKVPPSFPVTDLHSTTQPWEGPFSHVGKGGKGGGGKGKGGKATRSTSAPAASSSSKSGDQKKTQAEKREKRQVSSDDPSSSSSSDDEPRRKKGRNNRNGHRPHDYGSSHGSPRPSASADAATVPCKPRYPPTSLLIIPRM